MHQINGSLVAQLVNTLEGEGLASARLCRQAGIDLNLLRQPDGCVLRGDVYRLMMLAQAEPGATDIGLRAYRHFLPGGFQLVGYTMMSSPNLKGALESLVRYAPLLGSGVSMGLSREGSGLRLWGIEDSQDVAKPRAFEDAMLALTLGFCRWLTAGSLPCPREIGFTYAEPPDTSEHRRLFGCTLRFGAPRTSILFDRQALSSPLSTANEALALLHGRIAEHHMGQLRRATYSERTRSWLIERLNLGGHDMVSVAKGLEVSPRNLQRGLAREGTNFRDVLDDARRQLTDYYLQTLSYSLAQVSELVGFREPSSFHKACLRWFGMSPGRYRAQLCEERAGLVQGLPDSVHQPDDPRIGRILEESTDRDDDRRETCHELKTIMQAPLQP